MNETDSPLFDKIEPFNSGMLAVSSLHHLYYEESGNPDGLPVLLLHGGPGAGCSPKNRRRFNPQKFRIIMFDQRGCGQSTPCACLVENTTQDLVGDIEKLRLHLKITGWAVTGGSWGSTLALVYAIHYPQAVISMVLNGIFLAYDVNTKWLYGPCGVARIFPEAYDDYIHFLPEDKQGEPLLAYGEIIQGDDKEKAIEAAVSMIIYEGKIMSMADNTLLAEKERKEAERLLNIDEKVAAQKAFEAFAFTHSLLEVHYSLNHFFLKEDYILDHVNKLKNINITLIHGRYDMVCPLKNAYKLHKYLPQSQLIVVENAAHSTSEVLTALMEALDKIEFK